MFKGSKFDDTMSLKDIVKHVRADLAKALSDMEFVEIEPFSVRPCAL